MQTEEKAASWIIFLFRNELVITSFREKKSPAASVSPHLNTRHLTLKTFLMIYLAVIEPTLIIETWGLGTIKMDV